MHASRLALAHPAPRAVAGAALLAATAACAPRAAVAPLPPLAVAADSVTSTPVAEGVVHHRLWFARGPQAVHVLDVDRAACWTLTARKAGGAAVGRAGTLALVRALADSGGPAVAGGVNADFFLFAPPGVPVGASVQDGRLIAGPAPGPRPALTLDSAGTIHMGALRATGSVTLRDGALPLANWNRGAPRGVSVFDAAWGARTDSVPGRLLVTARVIGDARGATLTAVVTAVDSGAVAPVPADGIVLVAGPQAAAAPRARLAALRETSDGFEIARRDLEMRGPGEILGTRQAGMPQFHIADLLRDHALLPRVQQVAELLLREHPRSVNPIVRRWLSGAETYGNV